MATFTLVADTNIDACASKGGADTYDLSGFTLTVDQDSRYGLNQTTSASLGNIVGSATVGGTVLFDGTKVRLIPYDTGTGNVPASNTTISKGSASGKLIAVYSALNVAPTAAGAAMPASGYIKIKQWNSVAYSSGALTGIGANATGVDTAGWIEIVGTDGSSLTIPRRANFTVTGDWYLLPNTDGTRATTYQIPSNGAVVYLPGVWVETAVGSGAYEFYPCAGSQTALVANMATDATRGKVCWISTAGLLRFGHDGTNSTGGYIPPSGLKIRIPNIFFMTCTAATKTANNLPNATLDSRYTFYAGVQGTVNIDKCLMNWYCRCINTSSITLTNSGFMTSMWFQNIKSPIAWSQIGIGQEAANSQTCLTLQICFFGGTITDFCCARATAGSSTTNWVIQDLDGFTFTRCRIFSMAGKSATPQAIYATHITNCTWDTMTLSGGNACLIACANLIFRNSVYYDHQATTTPITNGVPMFDLVTQGDNITIDGVSFGGLFMVQPYLGILRTGYTPVFTNIKLRNLGTPTSSLDMGGPETDATWTRVTTTATVTSTAHGLKANDNIYVVISSSTGAIVVGSKTVATAADANTFTFTCLNAGAASGTITYYPRVSEFLAQVNWGANGLKIQRCYTPHTRVSALSDGSTNIDDLTVQNVRFDYPLNQNWAEANAILGGVWMTSSFVGQNPTYGTHWLDQFTTGTPANLSGVAWTRSTTTATVTSAAHGLRTGDIISITTTSDAAAIVLGLVTITALTSSTFTFTCLNAGAASGTLTFVPLNGQIGVMHNEATSASASQYTYDSGSNFFTGQGMIYMPTVGNQLTYNSPNYIIGHTGFPIAEAQFVANGGGDSITNYDMSYALDVNDGNGFGSFHNLYYQRAGGGGSGASTNVTMTSTTGVEAGDYIWGTGIAPNAKVSSITNSTTVVVDIANTGTVSGTLRFNHLPYETVPDAQNGFKLKIRIKTSTTSTKTWAGMYIYTTSTSTSRAYQYVLDPVTVSVTAKDVTTSSAISGAMVFLEAASGGALPSYASVTITRSGSVATVSHTAHGVPTNTSVIIRGATQLEYNGSHVVTYIDANSYSFTVTGTPTSPATGTITSTAQILKTTTNGSGVASATFNYTADQPVQGYARKGTAAPYYKTGRLTGTIGSTGLTTTVFLVGDS